MEEAEEEEEVEGEEEEGEAAAEEEEVEEDVWDPACEGCGSVSSTEKNPMLLCDSCDAGYHMRCLRPPLREVPAGKWYCPSASCQAEKVERMLGSEHGTRRPSWQLKEMVKAEEVDKKLWEGASAAGWRIGPQYPGGAHNKHWVYLAPDGVAHRTIKDAREAKVNVPPREPGGRAPAEDDCLQCRFCLDKKRNGGPAILKKPCILKQGNGAVVAPPPAAAAASSSSPPPPRRRSRGTRLRST